MKALWRLFRRRVPSAPEPDPPSADVAANWPPSGSQVAVPDRHDPAALMRAVEQRHQRFEQVCTALAARFARPHRAVPGGEVLRGTASPGSGSTAFVLDLYAVEMDGLAHRHALHLGLGMRGIVINGIKSCPAGTGLGSYVVGELCRAADQHGAHVEVDSHPQYECAPDVDPSTLNRRHEAFWQRHGFTRVADAARFFEREPRRDPAADPET